MSRVQPPGEPVPFAEAVRAAEGDERSGRARRVGRRDVVVDPERRVREVARERRRRRRVVADGAERRARVGGGLCLEVDVVHVQALERRACLIDLGRMGGVGVGEPVDAFPPAVEVVEAVVLLVDDDDVPNRVQLLVVSLAGPATGAGHGHAVSAAAATATSESRCFRMRKPPQLEFPSLVTG